MGELMDRFKRLKAAVHIICEVLEMIAAALLHDVIEDAGITYGELEREFGPRVADLVQAESEDKTLSWQERKQSTIRRLETALPEEKILCLGDKLSNLRSTASDRIIKGERVWEKFRVKDKKKHEWYYRRILEQLSELKERLAYREYVMLFQELFE